MNDSKRDNEKLAEYFIRITPLINEYKSVIGVSYGLSEDFNFMVNKDIENHIKIRVNMVKKHKSLKADRTEIQRRFPLVMITLVDESKAPKQNLDKKLGIY